MRRSRYVARISENGKTITLGTYKVIDDAILAYNEKAKQLFGEFARVIVK